MGSNQSSHANAENKNSNGKAITNAEKLFRASVRGRKSFRHGAPHGLRESIISEASASLVDLLAQQREDSTTHVSNDDADDELSYANSEASNDESVGSDDEDDDEMDLDERLKILQDAHQLKQYAEFYHHPETSLKIDAIATARCYFDRPSAPSTSPPEEEMEKDLILDEMKEMKERASHFMHPEKPVTTTDPFACGRNYFSRASGVEQESEEEAEERVFILEEVQELKDLASNYLHSRRVVTNDPSACGRNYFTRGLGPEHQGLESSIERDGVLDDVEKLKKLAKDYMHPEVPVVTTDPSACGRNYFERPSAVEYDDNEEAEERERVLAEAWMLKKLAVDYSHPEIPVRTTDAFACGRNFFTRPSADWEERDQILEDASLAKSLPVDYMHPELPVCARNYFARASAPIPSPDEKERDLVMKDSKMLKSLAVDYQHPELPVTTTDASACGRNYFTRASAPEQESFEDSQERAMVLAEAKVLKKLSVDYLRPEREVETSDVFACGRNYFARASSPEETLEEAEERARILEDAKQLKQLAVDYMHPELPVANTDPFACGRNYFTRPAAPEHDPPREAVERAVVLEELSMLKKLAVDFMHPELPVNATVQFVCCARNYFERPSAAPGESIEHAEELTPILDDAKKLKQLATDYLHPEQPMNSTDQFVCCARNYFERPSSVPQESKEDAEEMMRVLEDAKKLKKLATDYMHPELPVTTTDGNARGRNYFCRPSAPGHHQMIHTFPPHQDEIDHEEHHEHLDHFGMDEEMEIFETMRHDMEAYNHDHHILQPTKASSLKNSNDDEEEEGKLSRSPSSVMLFTEESIYD